MGTVPFLLQSFNFLTRVLPAGNQHSCPIGKPAEDIVLTEVVDGKTGYYRDAEDRHYVPKRALEDLVITE
jgi:hypothetical protein